jgi:hypothetical protein
VVPSGLGAPSIARLPANLSQIIAAWPQLPDSIKAAILTLVRAAGGFNV